MNRPFFFGLAEPDSWKMLFQWPSAFCTWRLKPEIRAQQGAMIAPFSIDCGKQLCLLLFLFTTPYDWSRFLNETDIVTYLHASSSV